MKNLKVSLKLILSFLLVIALTAVVGGVGVFGMLQLNAGSGEMYESNLVPLPYMSNVTSILQRMRVNMREYALGVFAENPAQITDAYNAIQGYMTQMTENLNLYEERISDDTVRTTFDGARALYDGEYKALLQSSYDLARAGDGPGVMAALSGGRAMTEDMVAGFDLCMTLEVDAAHTTALSNEALAQSMLYVIFGVLAVAVILALALAFTISSLIAKPLIPLTAFMRKAGTTGDLNLPQEEVEHLGVLGQRRDEIGEIIAAAGAFVERVKQVSGALGTVAEGDLTAELAPLSDKDTMGLALKAMLANLNMMFGEIRSASLQVSTGSSQVADSAQALAAGATQQAASIQELSGSIAEVAERTKENLGRAQQAAALAGTIKGESEKGSRQMDEMMAAVRQISDASNSISKVIKTIDDIAFQTNILALNAAVEAARAGSAGKGFAVVADEVRNLASKSAEAAKDTENLIANSMEKAELGVRIADETAASLAQIVEGIAESNRLVMEISASSQEQSSSIGQINTGVDQVAQVVQQNSATAEESAAASEEMSGQSTLLQELIARFRLNENGHVPSLAGGHGGDFYAAGLPARSAGAPSADDGFGKY